MYWNPHEYQKEAVKFVLREGCGQLWLDPGLGKTSIMLQALKVLKTQGLVNRVLIVAPLRPLYSVWPREIEKWDNFEGLTIDVLHGPKKDSVLKKPKQAFIHAINFEGLQWLSNRMRVNGLKYDMLIIDEISYMKNTRTIRFKTMRDLVKHIPRRFGLTGSPAPNSLLDVFGPQLLIDLGATFTQYITRFRTEYFMQVGYGGFEWRLKPNGEKAIYSKLANKVLRMSAVEHLDLPEMIVNDVRIAMPEGAYKVYKDVEDDLFTLLDSSTVTAANAAVAVMKCQQIANGAIYVDGTDKLHTTLHDAKLEVCQELVQELEGQPCIIGYHYGHDLARLQKAFPEAPVIGSGVTDKKLNDIVDQWNLGKIPVLLAHPQSAGHGLNLQGAGHAVIWFSNTWSLEIYEQFIRRLWRQGQKNSIVVHRLIMEKTVDEAIIKAIDRKDNTQQALLKSVKEYAGHTTESTSS